MAPPWRSPRRGWVTRRSIFVPTISSPAKIERIRSYGADLVVEGEPLRGGAGALPGIRRRQRRAVDPRLRSRRDAAGAGHGGARARGAGARPRYALGRRWRRRPDRRHRRLVSGAREDHRRGAASARRRCTQRSLPDRRWTFRSSGMAADSLGASRIGGIAFASRTSMSIRQCWCRTTPFARPSSALWDRLRIVAEPGGAAVLWRRCYGGLRASTAASASACSSAAATPRPWISGGDLFDRSRQTRVRHPGQARAEAHPSRKVAAPAREPGPSIMRGSRHLPRRERGGTRDCGPWVPGSRHGGAMLTRVRLTILTPKMCFEAHPPSSPPPLRGRDRVGGATVSECVDHPHPSPPPSRGRERRL